jgi:hypothetical protein
MIMAMIYEGFGGESRAGTDPGAVNSLMTETAGDFDGTAVNWAAAVHDLSRGALEWNDLGGSLGSITDSEGARDLLDYQLCGANPHPVILGVKHCVDGSGNPKFPCHFVLVTGRDGTDYTIADPATGTVGSLMDSYGSDFTTRGIVVGSGGGGQPDVERSLQASSPGLSSLDLAVDQNASMTVTDSAAHETGVDPASGAILQQIPGSAYFIDQIEDATELDSSGPADVTASGHILNISQPPQETLGVVVKGNAPGPFTLTIRGFSQDGSAQAPVVVQGTAQPGSTFTYTLAFNSAIGSTPVLTAMPGDRNGDGKVDCADLAIVKAAFGKSIGQAGYDPRADVNGDGAINIIDLATVGQAVPTGSVCK